MEEEKIILDKKSFGALAVDSRVNILKALRERRKTLTELSGELKLSVSSTKEHLDKITDAGLARKVEEGHKWKYYELTRKGEKLVSPDTEVRVWVMLGISFVAFIFSIMFIAGPSSMMTSQEMEKTSPIAATGSTQDALAGSGNYSVQATAFPNYGNETEADSKDSSLRTSQNISGTANALSTTDLIGSLPLAFAAISGMVIIVCFTLLFKRRIWS